MFSDGSLITIFYRSGCLLIVVKLEYRSTIAFAVTNLNLIMASDWSVGMPVLLEGSNNSQLPAFRKV